MLQMECTCEQKKHTAPVKHTEICEHAIEKVGEILKDYKKIYVICDKNTYEVAGKRVEEILKETGNYSHTCIIDEPGLPNNHNIGKALIEAGTDIEVFDISKVKQLKRKFRVVIDRIREELEETKKEVIVKEGRKETSDGEVIYIEMTRRIIK